MGLDYNVGFENTACDGGRCKTGTYKKISFENREHQKFYAVGNLVKKKAKYYTIYYFSGPMEIYYAENNQLLTKGVYDIGRLQPTDNKIEVFWSNGKLMQEYVYITDQSTNKRFIRLKKYNEKGELMADLETNAISGTYYNPIYFDTISNYPRISVSSWNTSMAHQMVQPSYINHYEKGAYLGYKYYGTYTTAEGVSMTGYTWPMVESMGNGSVVLVEEANDTEPYYAIFFNGKIDKRYTVKAEKTNSMEFTMGLDSLTKSDYSVVYGMLDRRSVTQPLLNMKMKDLEHYTGYGVDYQSSDNGEYVYTRTMRIGFFENGKLNGLGYSAQIVHDFKNSASIHQIISYQYGFFKDDVLVKGETNKAEGYASQDRWVKQKNPAIHFASYWAIPKGYSYNKNTLNYKTLPLTSTRIYVKSVNRIMPLVKIDEAAKKVIVQGTREEGLIPLSAADEPYLITQETPSTHEEECYRCRGKGIASEASYVTEYERVSTVQKGIYYNYYRSYSRPVKKKIYYDIVCPVCKGKGIRDVGNLDVQFSMRLITF